MLHILLCDDEPDQLTLLQTLIERWTQKEQVAACIKAYPSAQALLFEYEENKAADIFLLDVQMPGLSGIDLARQLRADGAQSQIIFITGYSDHMADGYDVSALHYLLKPVCEAKLFQVLSRAQKQLAAAPLTVLLPVDGGITAVIQDDILFAEVFSREVALHITGGTLYVKLTLRELEAHMAEHFFRCHRSYLVNMKHVRRVERNAIWLENGKSLPLARGLYDAAAQAFIRFR